MNEAQKMAYASRYFRTGAEVRLAKEENPFPQMKYDSVRLLSTPDFGNLNTSSYWQYICAPFVMYPELKKNDRDRYLTLLGGDMRNALHLGGFAVITVGRSQDALQVFQFERAVTVYLPAGVFYSIEIREISDPKLPILYSELSFSPSVKGTLPDDMTDFSVLFKSGEELWFKTPIHPSAPYPRAGYSSGELLGKEALRRRFTPVSHAYEVDPGTHAHTYDTYVCFTGTDPENMLDLGGEIELTIGEEGKELITFSSPVACEFFIGKGLLHGLPVFKKVNNPNRPILMTETAFTKSFEDGYVPLGNAQAMDSENMPLPQENSDDRRSS